MSKLLNKIENYNKNTFKNHKNHYEGLSSSQHPHTLLITCSDSRLCPSEFSETSGGELFIIRNAGNLMPAYSADSPSNEGLTLEYGVCALGIKEVIVCGHASCGAMGGLMDTDALEALPLVQKGLESYKKQNQSEVAQISNLENMIEWNVQNQLKSIFSYPFIKEKLSNGEILVQGIVYDFTKGSAQDVGTLNQDGQVVSSN